MHAGAGSCAGRATLSSLFRSTQLTIFPQGRKITHKASPCAANKSTMAISSRVHQEFFEQVEPSDAKTTQTNPRLIRILPSQGKTDGSQHSSSAPSSSTSSPAKSPPRSISSENASQDDATSSMRRGHMWTPEEHERFLEALEKYPRGPWKSIAAHVGNKTPRQVMSHAQKYRQKIARRKRGLKKTRQRRKKVASKVRTPTPSEATHHPKENAPDYLQAMMMNRESRSDGTHPQPTIDMSKCLSELEWIPVIDSCAACGHTLHRPCFQPPRGYVQDHLFQLQLNSPVDMAGQVPYHYFHHKNYTRSSNPDHPASESPSHYFQDPEEIFKSIELDVDDVNVVDKVMNGATNSFTSTDLDLDDLLQELLA